MSESSNTVSLHTDKRLPWPSTSPDLNVTSSSGGSSRSKFTITHRTVDNLKTVIWDYTQRIIPDTFGKVMGKMCIDYIFKQNGGQIGNSIEHIVK